MTKLSAMNFVYVWGVGTTPHPTHSKDIQEMQDHV
jgi:hypothetical protein